MYHKPNIIRSSWNTITRLILSNYMCHIINSRYGYYLKGNYFLGIIIDDKLNWERLTETIDLANRILQNVSKYMLMNKLHINLGKCCYMKFRPISNITETNLKDRLINEITSTSKYTTQYIRYNY